MTFLRGYLAAFLAVIAVYTIIVLWRDGAGLFTVYFGDLFALNWSGQFNLDFAGYLMLSGLWVAWRSGFSVGGIAMALIVSVAGMMVFAPLVLILAARANGDLRKLVLGVHAAA